MHDNLQICIPGLHISLGLFLKFFDMLVGECEELDTKIAWKLAESSSQLDGMGDLNEHFTLLRQAAEHSKAAQDYDAQAHSTEEYVVHLLTVASNVIVFDEGNENSLITSLLNSVKELKEKAENEDCCLIEEHETNLSWTIKQILDVKLTNGNEIFLALASVYSF